MSASGFGGSMPFSSGDRRRAARGSAYQGGGVV